MKDRLSTLLFGVILVAAAIADIIGDGYYTYNDGSGTQTAVVQSSGAYMEIGSDRYSYNPATDSYEQIDGNKVIKVTDQGYRYLGTNSATGACTFYKIT